MKQVHDDLLAQLLGAFESDPAEPGDIVSRADDASDVEVPTRRSFAEDPPPPAAPMREAMLDVLQEIEDLITHPGGVRGLPSGFAGLDQLTGGLQPGELTILAGRPSMGKTSLAMNMVRHAVGSSNVPAAFFSLDMGRTHFSLRLLSTEASVPLPKLRSGFVSSRRDFPRLSQAAAKLAELPLWIEDAVPLEIGQLQEKARQLRKQEDIRLIVVDSLQQLRSSAPRAAESREREVADVVTGLKDLARELELPVVATSQLNRQVERRYGFSRPRLSDLRESGVIEECADVVGLLLRDEYYAECEEEREELAGRAQLLIAKNRNGDVGDVPLLFRKERMHFEDRPRDEFDGD